MSTTKTRHVNDGVRKVCGCARTKWSKCQHPWHLNYTPKNPARRNPKTRDGGYRLSLDRVLREDIVDSKDAAKRKAVKIKNLIDEGKFNQPAAVQAAQQATLTVGQLLDHYRKRYVASNRKDSAANVDYQIRTIKRTMIERLDGRQQPFGEWLVSDVSVDTVMRFAEQRQQRGIAAANRDLALLRACWNWSILRKLVADTPFKVGTVTAVKLAKEHARSRRLEPGEADALLAVCGPHLRALVEAALESGCRKGELLSMQWRQIEGMAVERTADGWVVRWQPRAQIFLPHQKTKTKRDRWVPLSIRLRSILEMRRFNPKGEPHEANKYVFGDELGQRSKGFVRAWRRAVLVSHGIRPSYQKREQGEGQKAKRTAVLAAESREALKTINLRFHDLRREAGSRWLDRGMPLTAVRDLLGHSNISQTSTYLSTTTASLHDEMARIDALQPTATGAGTGGQTGAQTDTERDTRDNKNADGRDLTIM